MTSNPSPSSSSDLEEDESESLRVNKKRRYSPSFLPLLTIPGGASSHDEPSSSHCNETVPDQGGDSTTAPMVEMARLQARLVERELELSEQRREAETFLRELQESVECPVCFSIPRAPPVPCCQNGHVICGKCKEKVEVRNY